MPVPWRLVLDTGDAKSFYQGDLDLDKSSEVWGRHPLDSTAKTLMGLRRVRKGVRYLGTSTSNQLST